MSFVASNPRHCSSCGAELPPDAPSGQCVCCLFRLATAAVAPPELEALETTAESGKLFAHFEVLEKIARGGMGLVCRARDTRTKRVVALKVIVAGQFANEIEIRRFEFEAEAVTQLEHPNIIPIYEVGEHDGLHYFSMKLIEGGNLASRITNDGFRAPVLESESSAADPLSPGAADEVSAKAGTHCGRGEGEASSNGKTYLKEQQKQIARLVAKIARAVHHAHQSGILHRDLKPANILLDAAGEPYVSDFGLAKRMVSDQTVTQTDAILGSPHYMAPEQASGQSRRATTGADIYGLGVILYELLTGRVPFRGETPLVTLKLVLEAEPPRPSQVRGGRSEKTASGESDRQKSGARLDRDLQTICLKCLEKDPARRYRSAAALADDLESWLAMRPIQARSATPVDRMLKWLRREPMKAALIAVSLLAIGGPIAVATYYVVREMPYRATVHQIQDDDLDGVFRLRIYEAKAERCTLNFSRHKFTESEGRQMRMVFTNVPPELLPNLRVQVFADQAGRADPPRSPILTNGQMFNLGVGSFFDRAFYFGEVGFAASNLVAAAPQAGILVMPAKK